ncbi:hypothetical protein LJK88_40325 [Paenibacillus sp. P26]|nr:hypothetical protein LJK88_40325 [Paenibacillus sp. P26]
MHEVASNTIMMKDAAGHKKEMAYFSDFQLVMNAGNGLGALVAGALTAFLPIWGCFVVIAASRLLFYFSYRTAEAAEGRISSPASSRGQAPSGGAPM